MVVSQVQKEQEKDVYLEDIKTTFKDVHILLRPSNDREWNKLETFETIFDENQIVLESHDLEF
jgi:hypothetical protein